MKKCLFKENTKIGENWFMAGSIANLEDEVARGLGAKVSVLPKNPTAPVLPTVPETLQSTSKVLPKNAKGAKESKEE